MTKLSARTQISDANISRALLFHAVKTGVPNTSWKGLLSQVIPAYGQTVLYVSKQGNNTIANADPYYPFATIAAADAYIAANLVPSATNRIQVIILSGNWTESIITRNFVDYYLGNSTFNISSGAFAAIDDNGVVCDSVIDGNAEIIRSTGGTNVNAIKLSAASNIKINAKKIHAAGVGIILSSSPTLIINSTITSTNISLSHSGTANITINGGISTSHATQDCVKANTSTGGSITINGNINSIGGAAFIVQGSNVIIEINNSIITTTVGSVGAGAVRFGGAANSLTLTRCRVVNLGATKNAISVNDTGVGAGTLIIDSCTLIAGLTSGESITSTVPSDVLIYGKPQANKAINVNITELVGNITINASVI